MSIIIENARDKILPITAEEELIVRKYINSQFFEVEEIINYLNNNLSVGKEIFLKFMTQKGQFVLTYLNSFPNIRREKFIKRIPIYFYDVNLKNDFQPSLTDFFMGYLLHTKKEFVSKNFDEIEEFFPDDVDYEPVYKKLDDLIENYSLELDEILNYIQRQRGSVKHFYIFEYWYNYLKLIGNNFDRNEYVFPKNILYSYNIELEKRDQKPIIYLPATFTDDENGPYVVHRDKNILSIGGYFPIDNEGKPVLKWIGIWMENIKDFKYETPKYNLYNDSKENEFQYKVKPLLKVLLKIELTSDTRIFLAYRRTVKNNNFWDEEDTKEYWKLEYCGPALMKLDCSKITKQREKLKYSMKEVSEATGINLRTYQRIENGEGSPDGLNLIKIMNYLDITSYEDLIKIDIVEDQGFEKFLSGAEISEYLNEDK